MTAPTLDALRCSFCEHANPAGAKFCNDCGSPLRLKPCERCDAINDLDATSCHQCGAEFDEGLAVDVDAGPATTTPLADFKPSVVRAFEATPTPPAPGLAESVPAAGGSLTPILDAAIVEPAPAASSRRRKALAALFVAVLVGGAYGVYRYANSVDGSRDAATIAAPDANSASDAANAPAAPSKPIRVANPETSPAAPTPAATATPVTGDKSAASPAAALAAAAKGGMASAATLPAATSAAATTSATTSAAVTSPAATSPAATSAATAPVATAPAAEQPRMAAARVPRGARGRTRSQPAPAASGSPALPVAPAASVRPAPVAPANCTAGVAALGLCTRP